MTNRIEVEWIDIQDSQEEIQAKIIESNRSLFPVCDGELDKVLGILSSKKFLITARKSKTASLRTLLEPARIVPENMKALTALEEFKANKAKMAVVVDEYGSVQGLITQSDLFESIIAEHDLPDEENETSIVQRNENSFLVDALLPFEEFLQYFEIEEVATEDRTGFHSLGGFILHLSKQIPATGEKFTWKNFEFEVVDMDGNRIDKILLTIQSNQQEES
jgi:putative hemolysin